jgi:hypothetical protein
MDRDNVTSIEAHKIADLMMQEWLSSYSDNGAIWDRDYQRLQTAKGRVSEEIVAEAYEIAKARWKKMHKID